MAEGTRKFVPDWAVKFREAEAWIPREKKEWAISYTDLPPNYIKLLKDPKVTKKLFRRRQAELADYMRDAVRTAKSINQPPINPNRVLDQWLELNRINTAVLQSGLGTVISSENLETVAKTTAALVAYPTGMLTGAIWEVPQAMLGISTEASKAWMHQEKLAMEMLDEGVGERLIHDLSNLQNAFMELGRLLIGGQITDEDWEGADPLGFSYKAYGRGGEVGRMFAAGAVSGTAMLVRDLVQGAAYSIANVQPFVEVRPEWMPEGQVGLQGPMALFDARYYRSIGGMPLTTAMVALPLFKAAVRAGAASSTIVKAVAVLEGYKASIKKAATKAAKKSGELAGKALKVAPASLIRTLFNVAGTPPEVAAAVITQLKRMGFKRGRQLQYAVTITSHWLNKSWSHWNGDWAAILRYMSQEEALVSAIIKGGIEELARAIEQGKVKLKLGPDGVLRHLDETPLSPVEVIAAIEEHAPGYHAKGRAALAAALKEPQIMEMDPISVRGKIAPPDEPPPPAEAVVGVAGEVAEGAPVSAPEGMLAGALRQEKRDHYSGVAKEIIDDADPVPKELTEAWRERVNARRVARRHPEKLKEFDTELELLEKSKVPHREMMDRYDSQSQIPPYQIAQEAIGKIQEKIDTLNRKREAYIAEIEPQVLRGERIIDAEASPNYQLYEALASKKKLTPEQIDVLRTKRADLRKQITALERERQILREGQLTLEGSARHGEIAKAIKELTELDWDIQSRLGSSNGGPGGRFGGGRGGLGGPGGRRPPPPPAGAAQLIPAEVIEQQPRVLYDPAGQVVIEGPAGAPKGIRAMAPEGGEPPGGPPVRDPLVIITELRQNKKSLREVQEKIAANDEAQAAAGAEGLSPQDIEVLRVARKGYESVEEYLKDDIRQLQDEGGLGGPRGVVEAVPEEPITLGEPDPQGLRAPPELETPAQLAARNQRRRKAGLEEEAAVPEEVVAAEAWEAAIPEEVVAAAPDEPVVVTRAREKLEELGPVEPPKPKPPPQPGFRLELEMEWDPLSGKMKFPDEYQSLVEQYAHDPVLVENHRVRLYEEFKNNHKNELLDEGFSEVEANRLAHERATAQTERLTPEKIAQLEYGDMIPVERVNAVFEDPFYQKMIDEVIGEVQRHFPEESFIITEAEPYLGALRDVRLVKGAKVSRQEIQNLITSVLRDTSTQLLRSDKLRMMVAKNIVKTSRVRGLKWKEIDGLLKKMAESHLLEQPFSYRVKLPDGRIFNLFDEFVEQVQYLDQVDPGTMNGIRANSVRRIGQHLAHDVSRRTFVEQMVRESTRYKGTNTVTYTDGLVSGILIKNRVPPNLLNKFTPEDLARQLRGSQERYVRELMEATGMDETSARARILDLADDIEASYVEPSAIVKGALPEGVTGVHKVFNDMMTWQMKSLNSMKWADSWIQNFTKAMKVNLTARNIPTHMNNFVANIGLQSVRRGQTPMGVIYSLQKTSKVWKAYRDGTLQSKNPKMYELLREVERSGLIDSTMIDAELGAQGFKGITSKITGGRTPLQDLYRWGDNVFKLDETIRNINTINTALTERLQVGEWIKIKTLATRIGGRYRTGKVYIHKTGPDSFAIRGTKGRVGSNISRAELNKLIVKSAMESAQELFFDYADISNFGKFLRATPLLGLISPFYSWFWKALDIPFVKKGLVGKVIEHTDPILATSSKSLNVRMSANALGVATRRAATVKGMQAGLDRLPPDEQRKFYKRIGKDVGIILFDNMTDPAYASYANWEAMNWGQPTEMLLRTGLATYTALFLEPEDIYPLNPDGTLDTDLSTLSGNEKRTMRMQQDLWAKYEGGQLWDMTDLLQLIGLSGTPLVDMITTIEGSVQKEAEKDWKELYRQFGNVLWGGTIHNATMVALGYIDPSSPYGTRQFALSDDSKEQQSFVQFWMRSMFKMGYSTKRLARQETKYFADFKRAISNSLKRTLEIRRKNFLKLDDLDAAAGIRDKQTFFQEIINHEMEKMQGEWRDVRERTLGH